MSNLFNKDTIFSIDSDEMFNDVALSLYAYHLKNNATYKTFIELFAPHASPQQWQDIPCLPVSFFKTHDLYISPSPSETVFTSSGTTGSNTSRHFVANLSDYHSICTAGFERAFGSIKDYTFCCLLPSYMERSGSSLIEMCRFFIEHGGGGGFYLYNIDQLLNDITQYKSSAKKVVLIGVSFALLDLAESMPNKDIFRDVIVMETGGMKGRRKEITRMALHEIINVGIGVSHVASEYGMTELMSQAYAKEGGVFVPPPWMRVTSRHVHDPRDVRPFGRPGLLNIYDLANWHSMPFVSVDDVGVVYENNTFEVMGRYDSADVRGCNLMVL